MLAKINGKECSFCKTPKSTCKKLISNNLELTDLNLRYICDRCITSFKLIMKNFTNNSIINTNNTIINTNDFIKKHLFLI